jgi:Fe-S-cluster-containing dehydrogenase component
MARYGLLIDYDFCTGCHTCEVACQQEHGYPAGRNGIRVTEHEYQTGAKLKIDYLPFLTDLCDLCMTRHGRGEQPACVKHCQSACMEFGLTEELAAKMGDRSRVVLYTHAPAQIGG